MCECVYIFVYILTEQRLLQLCLTVASLITSVKILQKLIRTIALPIIMNIWRIIKWKMIPGIILVLTLLTVAAVDMMLIGNKSNELYICA